MRNVSDIVDWSGDAIHYHVAGLRSSNCRRDSSEFFNQLIRMDVKQTGRDISKRSICKAQHNYRMNGIAEETVDYV